MIAYRREAAKTITTTAIQRTIRRRYDSCWLSAEGTTVTTGATAVLVRAAPATKFGRDY